MDLVLFEDGVLAHVAPFVAHPFQSSVTSFLQRICTRVLFSTIFSMLDALISESSSLHSPVCTQQCGTFHVYLESLNPLAVMDFWWALVDPESSLSPSWRLTSQGTL